MWGEPTAYPEPEREANTSPDWVTRFASGPSYETWIRSWNFSFSHFNERLFDGELSQPLFTYTGLKCAVQLRWEYYADKDGRRAHRLAFNAARLKTLTDEERLSVLVYGMAQMKRYLTPPRPTDGYCDARLARIMTDVGLIPSSTGEQGGAKTGYSMGYIIEPDGPFDAACRDLLTKGFTIKFIEKAGLANVGEAEVKRKKKNESKTKFCCPICGQNAWAKLTAKLKCDPCDLRMVVAHD
jgi:hypothetical protein